MSRGSVIVNLDRCKGCGFCVAFCPTHCLELSSAFNGKGYHPPHLTIADKFRHLRLPAPQARRKGGYPCVK